MKNAFDLILEALSNLKIFKFCLYVLVVWKKQLDQKGKINFKIYDVTTIALHVLPIISQSKDNQTMKFGQVIDITREIFFFKIHTENETGRLVTGLFCFLKKVSYEVKASGLQLSFNTFGQSSTQHTIKTKCIKLQTIDPEIC